jgi:two-component system response regulator FlrC
MKNSTKPSCRVLVVDDEETICRNIRETLTHGGHHVNTAESGEKALSLLHRRKFDVVVLDRAMVGFKGDELAARVKESWPDLPIIMMTAFAMDFNLAGRTFKCVDYIMSKTFASIELLEALARVRPQKLVQPEFAQCLAA